VFNIFLHCRFSISVTILEVNLLQFLSLSPNFFFNSCRFKCIDLDGNGVLTPNEMQFFYEEQLHRMECMAQEPVLFEDILCQIVDMIGPEVSLCSYPCIFALFTCFLFYSSAVYAKW